MAIGLEMVDPNLKCNIGIFLGMTRIKDVAGKVGHEKLSKTCTKLIGCECNKIVHAVTLDRSAKGIAIILLHHDEDACDMRDCIKIGQSAIEDFIRERSKVQHFLIFNLSTSLLIFSVSQIIICTF